VQSPTRESTQNTGRDPARLRHSRSLILLCPPVAGVCLRACRGAHRGGLARLVGDRQRSRSRVAGVVAVGNACAYGPALVCLARKVPLCRAFAWKIRHIITLMWENVGGSGSA